MTCTVADGVPMTMRAWVFDRHGDPAEVLRLLDHAAVPEPGSGQVLIRMSSAAVNFADDLIIRGSYQSSPPLPAIPGTECAGRVVAIGTGVDLELGSAIAGLGYRLSGGFGEYVLLDASDAFVVPAGYSADEAAAFTVAYQTAWFAVHTRGGVASGETVLVHSAAGGVGRAAVQLAVEAGARVFGIVGSEAKILAALDAGCERVFLRGEPDIAARLETETGGRGIDLVVDPVGGAAHAVSERAIGFEGRIVLVGFASGDLPVVRPDLVMVKNFTILGLHWGLYRAKRPEAVAEEYARLVDTVAAAGIRPLVSEVFDFGSVPAAIAKVADGHSTGRVVVRGPVAE